MLSVMLMREADAPIFERTKLWLEEEESVFHLVIDELHLHRLQQSLHVVDHQRVVKLIRVKHPLMYLLLLRNKREGFLCE